MRSKMTAGSKLVSSKDHLVYRLLLTAYCLLPVFGCATPQYAVRETPVPDESAWARQIELTISAAQARDLEQHGVRRIRASESLFGFDIQPMVDRLSRVTERPSLSYHAFLIPDKDPNAAALADGRVYLTTGMLQYLASRGSRASELAFVLGHEIGHTVAQHLVKRYQQLQREQMMLSVVELGAAVATRNQGPQGQQLSGVVKDVAGLVADVINSGYSQEQELEADQLGIRYVIRAGYDPWAVPPFMRNFAQFDVGGSFLRTHPAMTTRAQYLERYLMESGVPSATPRAATPTNRDDMRARLREAQKLYPVGSRSWKNLQRQLDELN